MAGASGQMNSGCAASAVEAVGSDCGESAGHVGVLLVRVDFFFIFV
jgi:hypothetical protein